MYIVFSRGNPKVKQNIISQCIAGVLGVLGLSTRFSNCYTMLCDKSLSIQISNEASLRICLADNLIRLRNLLALSTGTEARFANIPCLAT